MGSSDQPLSFYSAAGCDEATAARLPVKVTERLVSGAARFGLLVRCPQRGGSLLTEAGEADVQA